MFVVVRIPKALELLVVSLDAAGVLWGTGPLAAEARGSLGISRVDPHFLHQNLVAPGVLGAEPYDEAFFWATHQGAEIDLILRRGTRLLGVECKRSDAPRLTPSIRIAREDLGLERVSVVYPGARGYRLADRVEAVPLQALAKGESIFAGAAS